MFEFELLLTGYSVFVATTSAVASKLVFRKQLKKAKRELSDAHIQSKALSLELKKLKAQLKNQQEDTP